MDPLSDVLRAVRLSGAYFYLVEAAAPWSVSAARATELAPRVLPDAEHLIPYHILTQGECWAGIEGEPKTIMRAGDVIVFPQGDPHVLASSDGTLTHSIPRGVAPHRFPTTLRLGVGDTSATLVCGFLGCDARPFNPLLAALPRVLHLPRVEDSWLAAFPEHALRESRTGRAGGDTMLTRMAELMFIEVLRRHLEGHGGERTGWLAGLRDPVVGVALTRIHEQPAHAWTLATLAREVAASRSVLAERFTQLVGVPVMQYLAQWRLQLAAGLLQRGDASVASVGRQVGYDSEAAFSRAFKRALGVSPAQWRKNRMAGAV
jgi:AraC-like DNA-binding protein